MQQASFLKGLPLMPNVTRAMNQLKRKKPTQRRGTSNPGCNHPQKTNKQDPHSRKLRGKGSMKFHVKQTNKQNSPGVAQRHA